MGYSERSIDLLLQERDVQGEMPRSVITRYEGYSEKEGCSERCQDLLSQEKRDVQGEMPRSVITRNEGYPEKSSRSNVAKDMTCPRWTSEKQGIFRTEICFCLRMLGL